MKERIKKIRKKLQLTQTAFAEKIGMKQNSIALVESGKRNISDYTLRVICREFNVNEEWLRYGEGEMFNPTPASELEALANKYNLSNEAQILIEKFINLKPEHQGAVIQFILQVADSLNGNENAIDLERSVDIADNNPALPETSATAEPLKNSSEELSDEEINFNDMSIDEQVELYRQELEREKRAKEELEVLRKNA